MQGDVIQSDAGPIEWLHWGRHRHRHRTRWIARLFLRGKDVGANNTHFAFGHSVLRIGECIELDRNFVAGVDEPVLAASDIGFNFERRVHWNQSDERLGLTAERSQLKPWPGIARSRPGRRVARPATYEAAPCSIARGRR